jgi:hypothetical protein
MEKEIETIIKTQDNIYVRISDWQEDMVWVSLQARQCNMYLSLTREEAQKVMAGLQSVLDKETV